MNSSGKGTWGFVGLIIYLVLSILLGPVLLISNSYPASTPEVIFLIIGFGFWAVGMLGNVYVVTEETEKERPKSRLQMLFLGIAGFVRIREYLV
ncbi:hypothetical protein A3K34_03945 [candidate division WWE3 bacterium RIFOXYC1_FULL_40_10]|uniref:Uncharacterized protein n=1 Tax=candidate division WWE3 bacterium RIFOXYA2_FULL_46_9 TaxID=1802636 RepID=A0A1F4W0H6_UNCKA|nr:MAG: hypothetical protein A3K58_03945 [candidate division WWE3 bacterium RIFOXYB1_FULL_40_22]OGC61993.1 MAG: hypothetical protein A3K37_03945 [candidate division WWE3 bacterium RIFOXYA1_FULL_40_11]OGC62911.1 MAG: hypothetical protein A2264_03465 [candidate division WWE3 bacterium RIFOXYA2_FULL_46_9]OGC65063.1 MAG: hypothetical protein A2326_03430 [candidate division WWE3 bacterium RIFOXYB2_FULL_41_6]OGC66376.1 MAG: hypothetical protein A3K34_03945 [candidate division WWE3 bacterium RIFOXYC1_